MTPQEALTRARGRISALTTFRVGGSEVVTLSNVLAAMDVLIGEASTPAPAGPPDISVAENPHGVKVGQVWVDNDRRSNGRHVKVVKLLPAVPGEAHHRPKSARAEVHLCRADGVVIRTTGRPTETTIRLTRFTPTSTGYRLVRDVDAAPSLAEASTGRAALQFGPHAGCRIVGCDHGQPDTAPNPGGEGR